MYKCTVYTNCKGNRLHERILLKTGSNTRHFLFKWWNKSSNVHLVFLRYIIMNRHWHWVSFIDTFSYARKCYSLISEEQWKMTLPQFKSFKTNNKQNRYLQSPISKTKVTQKRQDSLRTAMKLQTCLANTKY